MVTQYLCFSSRTRVHPSVLLSSFSHGVRQVFTRKYCYRHSSMVSDKTGVYPTVLLTSLSQVSDKASVHPRYCYRHSARCQTRQVFTQQYCYRHSAMVSDKISVHPTVLLSSLSHGVRQDRCLPNSTVVVTQHWEESELLLLFPFRGCGEQRQSHYLRNGRGVSSAITTPTIPEKSRSAEETEKRSY